MASDSQCRATVTTSISDCITTLVEVSELPDELLSSPPERACKLNDSLSPWNRTVTTTNDVGNPPPTLRRERSSSSSPLPRRPHTTPAASTHSVHNLHNNGVLAKKNLKFRGVLHTLLCSERQDKVEPSFQHLSDSKDYIAHYRHHHHPGSAAKGDNADKNGRPQSQPAQNGRQGKSATSGRETKRCSREQRGCPHYIPRSPCIKTDRQAADASRPPSTATSARNFPIAVKGKQMDSDRHSTQGERGRRKFRFSKDRRAIIAEIHSCKRIRLTWHQYLKYFSKPRSQDPGRDDDEKDSNGGCTERPTTPLSPNPPPRAATCVPVLDYDQSRVGTPVSPFRFDQSARRTQVRPSSCCGDQGKSSARRKEMTKSTAAHSVHSSRVRLAVCSVMDIQEAIKKLQFAVSLRVQPSPPSNTKANSPAHSPGRLFDAGFKEIACPSRDNGWTVD